MASTESAVFQNSDPHRHIDGEVCPLCEQAIPPEKLVEIQQRERSRAKAQERKVRAELAGEKAKAIAEKNKEIEVLNKSATAAAAKQEAEFVERELAIRAKAEADTETKMNKQLAAANDSNAKLQKTISTLTSAQKAENIAAEKRLAEASQKAKKEAEALMAAQIQNAEKASNEAKKKLVDEKKAHDKAIEAQRNELETASAKRIEKAEKASITAEKKLADEKNAHQKEIKTQRKALEVANATLLAEKEATHFRERNKYLRNIQKLERSLERKTADERGEGSEIVLYDALKDTFEDDKIKRVGKGEPGADVIHDVKYKGEICGRIVYDSKDHTRWATSFAKKLRTDQLAAEADHAILSLAPTAFPAEARQIELREGVILANPARVVVLVSLLREHIIRTHRMSLSNKARDEKMEVLYDFLNSDRCAQLFSQFDAFMEEFENLDVTEKKAHERTWKKRGELCKSVIKLIRGQLSGEIDRILEESVDD